MNDIRQGITAAQHELLDLIESEDALDPRGTRFETLLADAKDLAGQAWRAKSRTEARALALESAAHLMRAAERIDALDKREALTSEGTR
jgi:hypothetical protein